MYNCKTEIGYSSSSFSRVSREKEVWNSYAKYTPNYVSGPLSDIHSRNKTKHSVLS